ncbi:MAG TPA: hypothetical protein DCM05_08635 [Elusimicrobia bacterium]|nr:hypothetical protein [Elusimicrobiota bacterium]
MSARALAALLLGSAALSAFGAEEASDLGTEDLLGEAPPASCAVLWAPAGPLRADAVADLLEQYSALRPTLAVAPDAVDDSARLSEWASKGRIELALRIPGDPLLPLIASLRPEDAVSRIVLAKQRHQKVFGAPPKGLVSGGGAFSQGLAGLASSQGLRWVSVGDYQEFSSAPWQRSGRLLLLPTADPAVYLLDPLTRELPAGAERCTATASETAERAAESAVDASTGPWPAWTGPLEGWAEDPGRKTAWDLYAQAAEALTQYQNSGRASLSVLDKAVAALYAAQDSRFYRSPPSELDKRELSTRLKKVYRLLGLSAPGGLAQKSEPGDVPEPDSEPAAIVSGRDGNRLWFELPQDNAPEGLLKSLLVSWDKDAVAFELTLRSSVPAGASLDVYMDINHRSGAGSIDLLPGRASFLNAADAWEYALTLSEDRAVLYRFIPGQGNVVLDKPRVSGDPREGDVRVSVPRARLRGNPAAWGYAALLMRGPDAPFDVLAVASPQRKTAPGDARYRRYSALRLKGQGVRP